MSRLLAEVGELSLGRLFMVGYTQPPLLPPTRPTTLNKEPSQVPGQEEEAELWAPGGGWAGPRGHPRLW